MGRQYLPLPSPASEGYFLVILVSVCLMISIVASFTIFLATLRSTCGFGHLLGAAYTTPVRTNVNLTSDLDSACSITIRTCTFHPSPGSIRVRNDFWPPPNGVTPLCSATRTPHSHPPQMGEPPETQRSGPRHPVAR